MKIKLNGVMAGPRGTHGAGCVLTVGKHGHIDKATAEALLESKQAEEVKAVDEKPKKADVSEERADEKPVKEEAPKEDTPKEEGSSRKSKGRNPRGR